MTSRLSG